MPKITPVPYQTLVRVFEQDGFQLQRTRGDHLVYTKPGIPRPIVIPMVDQVPVFIIRNNLRSARMAKSDTLNSSEQFSLREGSCQKCLNT